MDSRAAKIRRIALAFKCNTFLRGKETQRVMMEVKESREVTGGK
jgi:hypothetical protein